mgnify:CR=1 FL=1
MAIQLGILEDDSLTRFAVSEALEQRGFEVKVSVPSASEFVEAVKIYRLDAVLLDLHLGLGPTGLDVANHMRSLNPNIGIVMLTSFDDPRLLAAGIGEIPKGCVYLVKKDVRNMDFLEQKIKESIQNIESTETGPLATMSALTDSQIEILRLIANGYSNGEIAKKRFVSEKTVESTISRIAKLLDLEHRPGHNARMEMAHAYFKSTGVKLTGAED